MKISGRGCPWAVTLCALAAVDLLIGLRGADAHGILTEPKVEFPQNGEDITAYSATIDGATALPVPAGMHYDWGPSLAVEAFGAAIGNSSYKTLREFVMKHQTMQDSKAISPECGRTKGVNGSGPQPLPEKYVVWQHGDNEGFTPSHEGPCELWCDDERVFSEKNCAKTYSQIPAKLPYERAKCVGKKRLQIVWLALHETRWQVYMNCAHLANAQATTPAASTVESPKDGLGTVEPFAASSLMPTTSSTPAMNTKTPSTTMQVFPQVETQPPAAAAASTATLMSLSPTPMTKRPPTSTPAPAGDEYSNTTAGHASATRPPASVSINARPSTPPTSDEDTSASTLTASGINEESSTTHASHSQPCEGTMHSRQRPFRPVPWPRRATEESEEDGGSGSLASMDTDSWNLYAEKATGPIPEEFFEAARRDFEAEEKERRMALKQEFGYA